LDDANVNQGATLPANAGATGSFLPLLRRRPTIPKEHSMTQSASPTEDIVPEFDRAHAMEENYRNWFLDAAQLPGVRVSDGNAFQAILTPSQPHPLVNCVLQARFPSGDEFHCAREIDGVFSGNKVPYRYFLGPSSKNPDTVRAALHTLGRQRQAELPALWLDFADVRGSITERIAATGLRVVQVENRHQRDQWVRILAEGSGLSSPLADFFSSYLDMQGIGPYTRFPCFLGYANGQPAAVSAYYVGGGVVGLYCVATLPQHRRKGFAAAMSWAAIRRARQRDHAGIGGYASPMGLPVYQRMGFTQMGSVFEVY
jgi:GNAT superfamily N-acetyltransferase